jgi:hypothetical protein
LNQQTSTHILNLRIYVIGHKCSWHE